MSYRNEAESTGIASRIISHFDLMSYRNGASVDGKVVGIISHFDLMSYRNKGGQGYYSI